MEGGRAAGLRRQPRRDDPGAIFVAGPIFDAEHAICGAISVGVPKAQYSAALGRQLAARLKDVCRRLSDTLGEVRYIHEDRQLHELR